MMKLDAIRDEIQKVAEAISLVLKIDVTIVNEGMKRVAGTGIYRNKVGEIIHGNSAFKKSFLDKKSLLIDNPRDSEFCTDCYRIQDCKEEAEVCCPIILDDRCFGVIGLVAFDKIQRDKIMENKSELMLFLEKMATMISGNIKAEIKSYQYNIEKERIERIFDSMDRPVISLDEYGNINSCNNKFISMFKLKNNPTGSNISQVFDFLDEDVFLDIMKNSSKNRERYSGYYHSKKLNIKGVYNINSIYYKSILKGFVIDFVDKKDAIQNYNKINMDYRMTFEDIVGDSNVINEVKIKAQKASKSTSTIMISGESGTGKEMFARAIHSFSDRADGPFIAINCAAIPGELLESELFGYEEGAFTGAKKGGKLGMFEIANKGTIFLDEIGDMSLHLQAKLLRVLQEKEVVKVGGKKSIKLDVRIISATNKDIYEMVQKKLFREDLYYRLNVIPLKLPSLRDRREDIPMLVNYMLKLYSDKLGKKVYKVSQNVMRVFENYSWPGNIRELQNVVEFCINMTNSDVVDDLNLINSRFDIYQKKDKPTIRSEEHRSIKTIESIEREEIIKVLDMFKDYKKDKELAAEKLGISRATLYRKIKKYGIEN